VTPSRYKSKRNVIWISKKYLWTPTFIIALFTTPIYGFNLNIQYGWMGKENGEYYLSI
jgi:hypothetical protein